MVNIRKNDFIETGIRPNNAINTDKTTTKGRRGFAGYLVRYAPITRMPDGGLFLAVKF
jgi:hypothetical protein